jgi:hypothetical protein
MMRIQSGKNDTSFCSEILSNGKFAVSSMDISPAFPTTSIKGGSGFPKVSSIHRAVPAFSGKAADCKRAFGG